MRQSNGLSCAKVAGGRSKSGAANRRLAACVSGITLARELECFKKIIADTINCPRGRRLFRHSKCKRDRRYEGLAVIGTQPAINGEEDTALLFR